MAPKFGQNNAKIADFTSAQEIEDFFALIVRFSRSANLNTVSKISREPRELPWQPNLVKNKQTLH